MCRCQYVVAQAKRATRIPRESRKTRKENVRPQRTAERTPVAHGNQVIPFRIFRGSPCRFSWWACCSHRRDVEEQPDAASQSFENRIRRSCGTLLRVPQRHGEEVRAGCASHAARRTAPPPGEPAKSATGPQEDHAMPAKKPKLATRHRRPCDLLNRRAVSVRGVVTTDKPHWAFHRATRPACRDRRPRTSG